MAAIDYQSAEAGMLSGTSDSDSVSVGWVSDIIKWYHGEPNGQVSIEYQKQLSASSSYWLGQQENKAKLVFIRDGINDKYKLRIANLNYTDNGRSQKIGDETARSFIRNFNQLIEESIKKYLDEMRRMNNR